MNVLDLSRWQFGITTVYHFLFVPITIGLGFLVAGFETAWLRTGHDRWLRLAKFYGRLFLINFAMGVVTGIVQEFQFGMNWSAYSRFVGDIFGAPLAIEALLAFFLESTFIGLWIFGWDRLPPRLHAACMWIAATGTMLSAYFILAANSWMQHPVGFRYNPRLHREELTSFLAVMTNPVQLATFPHVLAGCFLAAGGLVTGVAFWHLIRRPAGPDGAAAAGADSAFRSAAKAGAITVLAAAAATIITGDIQGKLMTKYHRRPRSRVLLWSMIAVPLLPLIASSFAWIFTEVGRQPWLVFGQMRTAAGVSANSAGEVLASVIVLTLLYGGLAVVEAGLMLKTIRAGLPAGDEPEAGAGKDQPLALVY